MHDTPARLYRFEDFRLDTRSRELRKASRAVIPLTGKAFDTLVLLVENRHRIVLKDELLATIWAGRVVEENNLNQAISALRKALGTGAGEHRFIVTVPGRGYRFIADVQEETSEPGRPVVYSTADEAPARRAPASRAMGRGGAAIFGGLLVLLVLSGVAAWRMQPPTSAIGASVPQLTLAVLPFRSVSQGDRDELLELGLAETLITRLGRSGGLRVRSLASAKRFSTGSGDGLVAGRKLRATHVVEGSTQRIGAQVRVNVRLLSVANGAVVWTGTFDAPIGRVFTLQDSIGDAVTSALALQRIDVPTHSRSGCDGEDPAAYRALLAAHYRLHRRAQDTVAAFQKAIEIDPTCARAYAGLAMAYMYMAHNDADPREVFPLAKAAATQALRIDPESAEGWRALGSSQQLHDWAWADSEASMRRAIRINPSFADAHLGLAHLLTVTGRFDEGLTHARQARDLDPLSPLINALEAGFLSAAAKPEEAKARLRQALDLQPDFWIALQIRGGLALDRGDTFAAVVDLERAAERSQRTSQVLAVLTVAYVAADRRDDAHAILQELQRRSKSGYIPAINLAAAHNALGNTDAALDQLERAYRQRDIRLGFIKVDARWNNLRREPRFRAMAERIGLAGGTAHGWF